MRTLDAQRIENRDGVGNTRRERIRRDVPWLIAAALTAVIGEDQAELAA